jgi:hypothetical protein
MRRLKWEKIRKCYKNLINMYFVFSAEQLNLYVDRQEASERLDAEDGGVGQVNTVTFRDEQQMTLKERWRHVCEHSFGATAIIFVHIFSGSV